MTDQPADQQQPTAPPPLTPMEQIKLGTLRNLHDLYLWDVAEKQLILRGATADGYGFDPKLYARPFPGSPVAPPPIVAVAPQQRSQLGGAILAAALTATGLGAGVGGLLTGQLLNRAPAPPVAPAPAAPTASMVPVEYDVIFESNGKKIEVVRP